MEIDRQIATHVPFHSHTRTVPDRTGMVSGLHLAARLVPGCSHQNSWLVVDLVMTNIAVEISTIFHMEIDEFNGDVQQLCEITGG